MLERLRVDLLLKVSCQSYEHEAPSVAKLGWLAGMLAGLLCNGHVLLQGTFFLKSAHLFFLFPPPGPFDLGHFKHFLEASVSQVTTIVFSLLFFSSLDNDMFL